MPLLQCPKCKQSIEIKAMPPDNKVKCGHCSAEFMLKAPVRSGVSAAPASTPASKPAAPPKPAAVAPANTKPVDPNDPFASLDVNNIGKPRRVDFGVAPIPVGVAESPIGNDAPWLADKSPAYKPLTEEEQAKLAADAAAGNPYRAASHSKATGNKSGTSKLITMGILLALFTFTWIAAAIMVVMKSN